MHVQRKGRGLDQIKNNYESLFGQKWAVTTVFRPAELRIYGIDTYWMRSKTTQPQSVHLCTWEYFVQFTIL